MLQRWPLSHPGTLEAPSRSRWGAQQTQESKSAVMAPVPRQTCITAVRLAGRRLVCMHCCGVSTAVWKTEAGCPACSLTRMSALQDKQAPSSVEQPAIGNGEFTAAEQPWSKTIITPFVSASRRLLERCAAFLGYMRIGCCLAVHVREKAEHMRQVLRRQVLWRQPLRAIVLRRYHCVAYKEDYRLISSEVWWANAISSKGRASCEPHLLRLPNGWYAPQKLMSYTCLHSTQLLQD